MINPYEQTTKTGIRQYSGSLSPKMTSNIDESKISGKEINNFDEEYRLTALWWSDLYCSLSNENIFKMFGYACI